MKQQRTGEYAQVSQQVKRMRELYNQMGQPLPAEWVIDLYQHLGKALEGAQTPAPQRAEKRKAEA